MDIGQLILDALRSEYKNGATQTEMARRHGIPQSYMQRLLAGTRPAGGISIDTFQRMFPNAVIDLQGAVVGDNHGVVKGNNVRQCKQTSYNPAPGSPRVEDVRNVLHDVLSHIMTSEKVPDNVKVILYQRGSEFIKDHEQQ